MNAKASDTRHVLKILQQAMRDPSLSDGPFLLGELFSILAEDETAQALLDEIPGWKMPGLLLSAALLFQGYAHPDHPLHPYLTDSSPPLDDAFRAAVRRTLTDEKSELSALLARHTYQCNPPRRMAISLLTIAATVGDWPAAWHIDVGTASGIGLLLGDVRVAANGKHLGSPDAVLEYPLELRGASLDISSLRCPKIERSIGIDLDPPNLRDADCRAWMRACQYPLPVELAYFDHAVEFLLQRNPRIERGSAIDLLPSLAAEMPADIPLIVTDTYVCLFMSEEDRERLRNELDAIAQTRPVVWISNNSLVPPGHAPDRTTAGTPVTPELAERNRHEMFGAVCVTTWPDGKRTPRLVGISHPGGGWFEWRPDLANIGS